MSQSLSVPSDILTPADQDYMYNILDENVMENVASIFEENPLMENEDGNYPEDIKDVSHLLLPLPVMPVEGNILSNEEYPGPFEFEVLIFPNGGKNPWVFSASLNKIYMDIHNPFPVDFRIKNRPKSLLYIRVTPVYSLPQHAQENVYRCIQHEQPMEKSNRDVQEHVRQHIIRCSNTCSTYLGDKNNNERLSVIIPFSHPQTGTENVREMFSFVCKNSCLMPGMNRRPLEVIFTLENESGIILGRQVLKVRICSCPKRDKEKEERELNKDDAPLPRGKKRKIDKPEKKVVLSVNEDNKEYTLTVNLIGKQNYQRVLQYCHDILAGEIVKRKNGTEIPYQRCLNNIDALMTKPVE